MDIKNRFSGKLLLTVDGDSLSGANLVGAHLSGAHLSGADLRDADLSGANLVDANLVDANLVDADLSGANLVGADLLGANLVGADLSGADLSGANLSGADLRDADLRDADLVGADLSGANLVGADLSSADLVDANLVGAEKEKSEFTSRQLARYAKRMAKYRALYPDVTVLSRLDKQIMDVVDNGTGVLKMNQWHACSTTHCRAGWAITLAGDQGKKLEEKYGPARAGVILYAVSTGRIPSFYTSNERALADIRRCAANFTD